MKIAVQDIPSEGRSFVFHGQEWLPAEVRPVGDVRAELSMRREGARVLVAGFFDLKVNTCCDRCLADFVLPLNSSFQIDYELEGREQESREHSCRSEEMDSEFLAGTEIDLQQLLQQQYYLALPAKILCSENCKGLCSQCGANLNLSQCQCQQESSSAFSALRTLLK